jgi:diadenosine tetraphosphatase ApaH/serine/threonine PP2A family protein phosphatase
MSLSDTLIYMSLTDVSLARCRAMKVLNPSKWWLIRGNHETREVNGNVEHYQAGSFLTQCLQAFGDHDGHVVWEAVNTFFDTLPLAASIDNAIFCVHGGIPRELCAADGSLDLIKRVECPLRSAQYNQMVYDMLWSDPSTPEQETGNELDRCAPASYQMPGIRSNASLVVL